MFVKTNSENNILQYPYTIDLFLGEHKNVSFPSDINNNILASFDVYPVVFGEKPNHNPITEYTYPADTPEYIEGIWILNWLIGQKDANWIAVDLDNKVKEVRTIRDELLLKSDWITIRAIDINMPVDTDWAIYRQSLRDITSQEGFPWNIIWPTDPNGFTYK